MQKYEISELSPREMHEITINPISKPLVTDAEITNVKATLLENIKLDHEYASALAYNILAALRIEHFEREQEITKLPIGNVVAATPTHITKTSR